MNPFYSRSFRKSSRSDLFDLYCVFNEALSGHGKSMLSCVRELSRNFLFREKGFHEKECLIRIGNKWSLGISGGKDG